jgi:hypothetical protein
MLSPKLTAARTISTAVGVAAVALGLAGCGIGVNGNKTSKRVHLRVTTGFGTTTLGTGSLASFPGGWTVLDLTKRFATLSAVGSHIETIDGHRTDLNRSLGWSYYVNGIQATTGAGFTQLHPGDHVWWDLHDQVVTATVPAVVGAYPEPFLDGSGGQSYPTVVTCADTTSRACTGVTDSLSRAGIKVSFQGLGTGSGSDSLAVLVGTFTQLRGVIASELLSAGPDQSGVYAQFKANGAVLQLDDPAGQVTDTLRGSVGLIAATEQAGLNEPVWLVTGTDAAGVAAAARALTPAKLADHFAVAVRPDGAITPLPVSPTS